MTSPLANAADLAIMRAQAQELPRNIPPELAPADFPDSFSMNPVAVGQCLGSLTCWHGQNIGNVAGGELRCLTPAHILKVRDGLKVIGINAGGRAAQVIKHHSIRNITESLGVEPAVSQPFFTVSVQLSVAVLVSEVAPKPASGQGIDGVCRRKALVMTEKVADRLTLLSAFGRIVSSGWRCRFAATALT